jgi:hypothetical protein
VQVHVHVQRRAEALDQRHGPGRAAGAREAGLVDEVARDRLVLEPLELMARLAARVPPPRMHRTRYHGVFAIQSGTCARCPGLLL